MKRLTLILGAAAITAISAPVSTASAQGCSWWDVACRGLTNVVRDGGWHIAGRDANGNVLYVRERVDSNGNIYYEQSRRNNYGNYLVVNKHNTLKRTYIGSNGATCKYNENDKGYKEECKYAKVNNGYKVTKVHTPKYKTAKVKPVKYVGAKTPKGYIVGAKTPKGHIAGAKTPKGHKH
jgi:hypothetical protein